MPVRARSGRGSEPLAIRRMQLVTLNDCRPTDRRCGQEAVAERAGVCSIAVDPVSGHALEACVLENACNEDGQGQLLCIFWSPSQNFRRQSEQAVAG